MSSQTDIEKLLDTPLKAFGGYLALTVGSVLLAALLPSWLAWIPFLFGVLFSYATFGAALRLAGSVLRSGAQLGIRAGRELANQARLRAEPNLIVPLRPSLESFVTQGVPASEPDLPQLEGEWLSMSRDHERLKSYANQLDGNRSTASRLLYNAIIKFNSDRATLLDQQLQILRLAYRAKRAVEKVTGLPPQKLSVERLPNYAKIVAPPLPIYLSGDQLARKYPLTTGGAGAQIGQLLANPNNGNLVAAAIATAAMIVMAKANLSRAARALEETRGDLLRFYADVRGTIAILARAHEEVVASSMRLKAAEQEIGELMSKVKVPLSQNSVHISMLDPDTRENIVRLWQWVICADAVHARAAV